MYMLMHTTANRPPVCPDVIPLATNRCGYNSAQIEQLVAHAFAVHLATHGGPAARPPHRPQPCAQPVAPGVAGLTAGVHGCPRSVAPRKHHPEIRAHHRGANPCGATPPSLHRAS